MVRAMDLAILRHVAEELIPFNKFLGVRVLSLSPGRVEMEVPWRDELIEAFQVHLHAGSAEEEDDGSDSSDELEADDQEAGRE